MEDRGNFTSLPGCLSASSTIAFSVSLLDDTCELLRASERLGRARCALMRKFPPPNDHHTPRTQDRPAARHCLHFQQGCRSLINCSSFFTVCCRLRRMLRRVLMTRKARKSAVEKLCLCFWRLSKCCWSLVSRAIIWKAERRTSAW